MSNGRILVVDDEPQILRAVQMKLRGAGYAVDTAGTAREALMKAGMRPPMAIRLRAVLRRAAPSAERLITVGNLVIDLEKRTVTMDERPVALTPIEYDLLRVLAQNEGKLLTHPALLREVWGPAFQEESNYLHVHISHLRRKIEPDPARPRFLLNQPGVGYRLVDPAEAALS
jgi:DNA-binding response OmpR family regulator